MKPVAVAAIVLPIVLSAGLAQACGACDEDKIAATYDYAVEATAFARHHTIVVAEISGFVDAKVVTARIAVVAPRVRGVQPGTVRTAVAPPAFSFEIDPTMAAPQATLADFQRRIGKSNARFRLVRVLAHHRLGT